MAGERRDSWEIDGPARDGELSFRTLYQLFAALADRMQVRAIGGPNQPMTEDAAKQLAHT